MPTDHRATLARIKRFDQLIAYLRDEMGWPIDAGDFEELTFEYTPEELGIDAKNAAKIEEIKRLRPLSVNQPWGIFFVKFEPKRLPVVALRRILSQVVLKKRATAKAAERAAWAADDLLFVSNYGEGDERRISFAHFSQGEGRQDLPTLKVLGWDNLDTALHLDDVAEKLTTNLAWPADEGDVEVWRMRWRSAFTLRHREVITTSRDLSIRLAELARAIRDRTKTALGIETKHGPLTKLMKAFQEALVHDLDANGFADMYAQTIAYGLLSARIADPKSKTGEDFAAHMRTNPFLKELMATFLHVGGRRGRAGGPGIDFDELGVSEVVELLDDANMEAVISDFGDKNPQEDPVIHFYEHFLAAYDKRQKVRRGVFYTPRSVVSYIVRSVDQLLRTEFGLENGLADTTNWGEVAKRHDGLEIPGGVSPDQSFVQILDPACGTGTFLVEVIDLIHKTKVEKWKAQGQGEKEIQALWNEYVPKHLLPRLHGYELLMAPYAIAHLKIGLKLYETGYRFESDERVRVYLTNALESSSDIGQMKLEGILPALAHEAQAVNEIKRGRRFTVVIGNPPYAGESANPSESSDGTPTFIGRLIREYFFVDGQPLGERNSKWLHDDYVKFIRFGQHLLAESSAGVLGYITNHSFIFNPTFRGMRQHLLEVFNRLDVLNLHGSLKLRERSPNGTIDSNVFDIEPGVAITLGVHRAQRESVLYYGDLWGSRAGKYLTLGSSEATTLAKLQHVAAPPFYLLFPQEEMLRDEYLKAVALTKVFPVNNTGMITKRDRLTIHYSAEDAWRTVQEFAGCPPAAAYKRFGLPEDVRDWSVVGAQDDLKSTGLSRDRVCRVYYRPFDVRFTYYTGNARGFIGWPVDKIMRHMVSGRNLALCVGRAGQVVDQGDWNIVLVSRDMTEFNLFRRGGNVIFPVYLDDSASQRTLRTEATARPNLAKSFLTKLGEQIGCETQDGSSLPEGVTPADVVYFAYAVLYSPAYRDRYAEFLRIDFPRLPLPGSFDLLRDLARLGGKLVALHLMESRKLDHFITTYEGPKGPEVGRVGWSDGTVWLDAGRAIAREGPRATKPGTMGFRGVPEEVWDFHIGGYQVCHKWLKDRKGRTLSADDIAHYQKIVVALAETIRIMKEIDEVIEEHGGWPGAFQSAEASREPAKLILNVAEGE